MTISKEQFAAIGQIGGFDVVKGTDGTTVMQDARGSIELTPESISAYEGRGCVLRKQYVRVVIPPDPEDPNFHSISFPDPTVQFVSPQEAIISPSRKGLDPADDISIKITPDGIIYVRTPVLQDPQV